MATAQSTKSFETFAPVPTPVDMRSVICTGCNMVALLDADSKCEFCRISASSPVSLRERRVNEAQMLFAVVLLLGAVCIAAALFSNYWWPK